MTKFSQGEIVGVPCTIQQGPFSDEKLVTVETEEGALSGFVKLANLHQNDDDDDSGYILGTVVAATREYIKVRLLGSFFTTALGVASVTPDRVTRFAG